MADWFKFYETDIGESRFQYAIHELPEVLSVWVGILSECCRHKSGTLSWNGDEVDLLGFSHRLNVTVPKVNEAMNLLVKIRYVEKTECSLTVLKWNEKQSEYCQKKTTRVPTVSRQCPDSVVLEERRGEETQSFKALKGESEGGDRESTAIRRMQAIFSEAEASAYGANNRMRFRESPEKFERVLADLEEQQKNGAPAKSWAAVFDIRWREFKPKTRR